MRLNPDGRDWGQVVNWDSLGIAYTIVIAAWTILLASGIGWLICHRNVAFVRMRNLPLAIFSTCFLQVYLVKIFLAYTTNGHFTCSAEFWVMSVYLPFGISLFQANTLQLRTVSQQQEKLLLRREDSISSADLTLLKTRKVRGLLSGLSELSHLHFSYVCIAAAMLLQFVITGVLYAVTPTLQGDWTSYGALSHPKGQALCRKSFEWIPSAFWQLFWSWCYGPYILYRVHSINEVHYWRLQTFLSVLAGLPGTPLWLAALHSPAFKPVNKWFVPPMWLAPGIMVMQFCTIFFPIYQSIEFHNQNRQLFHSRFSTERLQTALASEARGSMDKTTVIKPSVHGLPPSRHLLSITALEEALALDATPLLHFATKQDFTGENIVFLVEILEWRRAWQKASRDPITGLVHQSARAQLFKLGAKIYANSVSEQTAAIPVNLESAIRKDLRSIFESAIYEGNSKNDSKAAHGIPQHVEVYREATQGLWSSIDSHKKRGISVDVTVTSGLCFKPLDSTGTVIPPGFHQGVFEAAEASIKYLVLTNTWRRFVRSRSNDTDLFKP